MGKLVLVPFRYPKAALLCTCRPVILPSSQLSQQEGNEKFIRGVQETPGLTLWDKRSRSQIRTHIPLFCLSLIRRCLWLVIGINVHYTIRKRV